MAFEEAANEDLKKSEKNLIGNPRKGNPCCVVSASLATLSPVVTWEVENTGNLAKESFSRQSGEGVASFFLLLMQMCDGRNELNEGMSNISEPGLAGFNKS